MIIGALGVHFKALLCIYLTSFLKLICEGNLCLKLVGLNSSKLEVDIFFSYVVKFI